MYSPEVERVFEADVLFVDIDDTLVLWDSYTTGLVDHWEPNHVLFNILEEFTDNPNKKLFIWSTGGKKYAEDMYKKAFWRSRGEAPYIKVAGFEAKWNRIPGASTLFIDDDPLESFKAATIHPKELFVIDDV